MDKKLIGREAGPLICTPLIGKTREVILDELDKILVKGPDIIEWRADFFDNLSDCLDVAALARDVKKLAGNISVIFTIRSAREGGQPISLSDSEVIEINTVVCRETDIEYVDCELSNTPSDINYLLKVAHENGTGVIASFHNFDYTPAEDILYAKLLEAEAYGMDAGKIAVMPKTLEDVLVLLSTTLKARNTMKIPVITMSMGQLGAVTRLIGGIFGSSLTFAVGQSTSAPGQIPIEDLKQVMDILQKYAGGV
ncbi:MAG: type I 3-dehydroquinate dehydratase [Bacillota bacterium]|nr:type I 3-dehydroquinate dehydratase [Bacillota bacterium]